MKVEYQKNRLMIVPETEFEIDFLRGFGENFQGWHKTGQSIVDYKGILIEPINAKQASKQKEIKESTEQTNIIDPAFIGIKENKESSNG